MKRRILLRLVRNSAGLFRVVNSLPEDIELVGHRHPSRRTRPPQYVSYLHSCWWSPGGGVQSTFPRGT